MNSLAPVEGDVVRSLLVERTLFRPVKLGNTFEQTVERLAQSIKLGVVPSGERLPPERELARQLNVSRVTLREAIKALQDAGYVESRRGRNGGTFVLYDARQRRGGNVRRLLKTMGSELNDMLDYRHVIEPGAAELAARRGVRDADRTVLLQRLNAVRIAPAAGHRVADSRLHLAIGELSGSPSVAAAVADVQVNLDRLLRAIPVIERNIEHSCDQHAVIVEAILAGDERGARTAMTEHVEGTSALLRGFLA